MVCLTAFILSALVADPLVPGNHTRSVMFEQKARSYLVHVPEAYDGKTIVPVVLALHGFAQPAGTMPSFTGLNELAEKERFLVVYPSGTGFPVRWNSGGFRGQSGDDVGYIRAVLDDLAAVANVDRKRVYATGMSNGAMMCYRLAAELSDRIAAIAPVAGTMAITNAQPAHSVPVIHFHGTEDSMVGYEGPGRDLPAGMTFMSVEDSVRIWAGLNGCQETPTGTAFLPDTNNQDGCTVEKTVYGPGRDGSEVVLYTVRGGGHTWPGRKAPRFLGGSTLDIDASSMMWEFFQKHPRQ